MMGFGATNPMQGKPIQGVGRMMPGGMPPGRPANPMLAVQGPRQPNQPPPPPGMATMGPRMPMPILRRM
jgi:hypothetical protein